MMNIKITKKFIKGCISLLVALLCWEFSAKYGLVDGMFISSPVKVFQAGMRMISSGFIFAHFFVSLVTILLGFSLSIFFGSFLGLLLGFKESLKDCVSPFIFIISSIPSIALIPLTIVWMGIGIASKIFIVFLITLSPILINTMESTKKLKKKYHQMALSFQANEFFIFRSIIFYGSLRQIFSAINASIGKAITGLVVAEMFGYGLGLGHLVSLYGNNFQADNLFFIILIFIFLNIFLNKFFTYLENRIIKWN